MDDRAIVAQIMEHGEQRLFGQLVEKYMPMVLSKVLGMVKDRELAGEIAQQTFVKAYTNLNSWRGQQMGPWLITIAGHIVISHLDRIRRHRMVDVSGVSMAEEQYDEEHERRLLQLEEALNGLPDQDRQLVQLFYYERQKTETIAVKTGLSQQNVLVRLHRIRERLRKILNDTGHE